MKRFSQGKAYKINPEIDEYSTDTYKLSSLNHQDDGLYFHRIMENGKEASELSWFNNVELYVLIEEKENTMRETIAICKQREHDLLVIDEKKMTTQLDEALMETFVIYKGTRYTVEGNIYFLYIVV